MEGDRGEPGRQWSTNRSRRRVIGNLTLNLCPSFPSDVCSARFSTNEYPQGRRPTS